MEAGLLRGVGGEGMSWFGHSGAFGVGSWGCFRMEVVVAGFFGLSSAWRSVGS